MEQVAITGIGLNTALGSGFDSHRSAWDNGTNGFSELTCLNTENAKLLFGSEIKNLWELEVPQRKIKKWVGRKDFLAIATAWQAYKDSSLQEEKTDPYRKAVFIGSAATQIEDFHPYFEDVLQCVDLKSSVFNSAEFGARALAKINPISAVKVLTNGALAHVSQSLQFKGANSNFMDFELSGFMALQAGVCSLRQGLCDIAMVGAVSTPLDPFQMSDPLVQYDLIYPQTEHELNRDYLPARQESKGRVVGEGSCFFTLERMADAKKRNAKVYGKICGMGFSSLDQSLPWRKKQVRSLHECVKQLSDIPNHFIANFNGSPIFDALLADSLCLVDLPLSCSAPLDQIGDLLETSILYQICWSLHPRQNATILGRTRGGHHQLLSASPDPSRFCHVVLSRYGASGAVEVKP